MSGTNPTPGNIRNGIIAMAKDVPMAIKLAQGSDPALADFLLGKSLVGSWTVWVSILTPAITWLATYYGIGWDAATCSTIATVLTSLAMIVMRSVTGSPITGLVTPAPLPPSTTDTKPPSPPTSTATGITS